MWSPFYSKINTFNSILYVDWIFGFGYAKLTETNNREEFLVGGTEVDPTTETHGGLMWQAITKFYLSDSADLRINLTTVHYLARRASDSDTSLAWNSNYDLSATIGYSF